MKVIGTIRGGTVEHVSADAEDYLTAKAAMLAQVPDDVRLLLIRVER